MDGLGARSAGGGRAAAVFGAHLRSAALGGRRQALVGHFEHAALHKNVVRKLCLQHHIHFPNSFSLAIVSSSYGSL